MRVQFPPHFGFFERAFDSPEIEGRSVVIFDYCPCIVVQPDKIKVSIDGFEILSGNRQSQILSFNNFIEGRGIISEKRRIQENIVINLVRKPFGKDILAVLRIFRFGQGPVYRYADF